MTTARRPMQWITDVEDVTIVAGTLTALQLDTTLNQRAGSTITRLVGNMDLRVLTINQTATISWGVYLGTTRERSSGGTPRPLTPDAADWLCWEHHVVRTTTGGGDIFLQFPCDLRGQRRYRHLDSELLLVIENQAGGPSVEMHWSYRALVKLS